MGRYYEGEYDGEGPPPELWSRNFEKHIRSRVGRPMLRDLAAALEALPDKKLLFGKLADVEPREEGDLPAEAEVCAIGAYILHKRTAAGEPRDKVLRELSEHARQFGEDDVYESAEDTVAEAKKIGLSKFLAWAVSQLNDELEGATPEERYERVLAYVLRLLKESADPLPDWMGKPAKVERDRREGLTLF